MRARCAWVAALAAVLLACLGAAAWADAPQLRQAYGQLQDQMRHNEFRRPIHIDSAESADALQGDVYAVLDQPFEKVENALRDPRDWCAILTLPFNSKSCRPQQAGDGTKLALRIGRRPDQPVEEAYLLEFAMRPVASGPDYFETRLAAPRGPVGTRDYRISLAAIPLDGGRTFMHLSYSYGYGGFGRMAMQAYLRTAGADKIGFSVVGREANGQPVHIAGLRGAIERNVMRYYLAIEAHLASIGASPDQQLERRLRTWFDATEQYPRQLHEMDRARYLALKKDDYERQQARVE